MPRRNANVHYEEDVPADRFIAHAGMDVSADGTRAVAALSNVRPQKRSRREPSRLDDTFATWTPVNDADLGELAAIADTVSSLDVMPDDDDDDDEAEVGKRKRYQSSASGLDVPMDDWRPLDQTFLDALLRRHGLGDYLYNTACKCCNTVFGPNARIFRCQQCGECLQCEACVRERHRLAPLHCLWEWNSECWTPATLWGTTPNRAGLTGVGLIYQLGHHGFPCDFPGPRRGMVVMHVNGIHTIEFQYCNCGKAARTNNLGQLIDNAWYPATTVDPETCATLECLEHFRLLNVVGNVSVHDYVGTLERLTDPLRVTRVPDRYKAFGRMTRQFGFLQRAKRAGRGHEEDGLAKTKPGGLAVLCWACPQEGKNLPDGWRDVDPKYRFLYMLILALDANFRLKNRLRANEHQDPSLGPGLGYFVEAEPYKKHLRNYVAEKDVSTCIAFAALLQKDTRLTTGLRVSGVGGYANMDYILLSALAGVALLCVAISYDIVCQWKVHLRERAKKIVQTTPIEVNLDEMHIEFALPVWHASAHETTCQTQNSLSYAVGVGRTDGEGIERTWSILNPVGYATKEMGDGARHDAIENKVDHVNFEKNIGEGQFGYTTRHLDWSLTLQTGNTLARKLIISIAERDQQVAEFLEVDSTLERDLRRDWKKQVEVWVADRTQPNPYCLVEGKNGGPGEAAVLQELKAAEAAEAAEGRTPLSATASTASAFMKAGLQLEESQRRIRAEVKGLTLVTADRSSQIQELRIAFLKKLRTFKRLQTVFMPGVEALRDAAEEARDPERLPPKAEDIKLWLPSDLAETQRRGACARGVVEVEAKLRAAQCADALYGPAGGDADRAVGDRIRRVSGKYRQARTALIALKGAGFAPQFKELKDSDMNLETDAERANECEEEFLLDLDGGGGPGEDEEQLHESVRVEWSKARARRIGRMAHPRGGAATGRCGARGGLRGYAMRQVAIHRQVADAFHTGWNVSVATADGTIYRELLDGQAMDSAFVGEASMSWRRTMGDPRARCGEADEGNARRIGGGRGRGREQTACAPRAVREAGQAGRRGQTR
ncbi:hypothetical protein B0H13DRAFT_1900698 [Mycena leptocephala]|nr:hypothetical protein B0H13DRAFT_1900698 [Mycena leptocephala]